MLRAGQALVVVGSFSWLGANRDEWFNALGFGRWRQVEDWAEAPRVVLEERALLTLIDWGLPHQGARNAVTVFGESQVADRTQLVIVLGHGASQSSQQSALARGTGVDVVGACLMPDDFRRQIDEVQALSARRSRQRAALQSLIARLERCEPLGAEIDAALERVSRRFWKQVEASVLMPKLVGRFHSLGHPLNRKSKSASAYELAAKALGPDDSGALWSDTTMERAYQKSRESFSARLKREQERWGVTNPIAEEPEAFAAAMKQADATGQPVELPVGLIPPSGYSEEECQRLADRERKPVLGAAGWQLPRE